MSIGLAGIRASGFRCQRCLAAYPLTELGLGCRACADSVPSNLEMVYEERDLPPSASIRSRWEEPRGSLWRYEQMLPVTADCAVSLGEGCTPLISCPALGEEFGLPKLFVKNEAANPTWSFKDRLASCAVSWAKASRRPGVTVASSGNAGAAVAAYAGRADMPCIIFTTRDYPDTMQRFMRSFGAMVVALPTGRDRWTISRLVAGEWGWLPVANACDPPVGGHPAGIEGYKTIAFEICQELGWHSPDVVVVPVGYGDSIAGIHKGFKELSALGLVDRMPRLVAAEIHGSIGRGLALGAEAPMAGGSLSSRAFSAATPLSTYQAMKAVVESGGTAVVVDDAEILAAHRRLAVREGIFAELSSAMPAAAARKLAAAGDLDAQDLVVLLATSGGLKDVDLTATTDGIPVIQPELGSLEDTLRKRFGYAI